MISKLASLDAYRPVDYLDLVKSKRSMFTWNLLKRETPRTRPSSQNPSGSPILFDLHYNVLENATGFNSLNFELGQFTKR